MNPNSNTTVGTLASLFRESLERGGAYDFTQNASSTHPYSTNAKKRDFSREKLIDGLKHFKKKTLGNIFRAFCLNRQIHEHRMKFLKMIEEETPEIFAKVQAFNVIGDRESRDIDIVVFLDKDAPISTYQCDKINTQLAKLGYAIDKRELDINFVTIDEYDAVNFSHGGRETHNILIHTYEEHKQLYPPILTEEVEVELFSKSQALVKYIMDNLVKLVGVDTYMMVQSDKKIAYNSGGQDRICFAAQASKFFIMDPQNKEFNREVWKSLTLKYIQLILLSEKIYYRSEETKKAYFQKRDIVELFKVYCSENDIDVDVDIALQLLFRETVTDTKGFRKLFKHLHTTFVDISNDSFPALDWSIQEIDPYDAKNPTQISEELYREFLKCPVDMTEQFCGQWISEYGDDKIDHRFAESLQNVSSLDMHPEVKSGVFLVEQKTDEWRGLLKKYACGKNTAIQKLAFHLSPESTIMSRSHLLMGCFGECIASSMYNFGTLLGKDMTPLTIGMIVKDKEEDGSVGSCPDIILVDETEMIPVEIKTLNSDPRYNSHYFRSYSLATRQTHQCAEILNHHKPGVCTRGIVVFAWIHKPDDEDAWKFTAYGGIVSYE